LNVLLLSHAALTRRNSPVVQEDEGEACDMCSDGPAQGGSGAGAGEGGSDAEGELAEMADALMLLHEGP
jgi:hypothetical protein